MRPLGGAQVSVEEPVLHMQAWGGWARRTTNLSEPTVMEVCSDSFGQVLKTAHPSIQATTKAILPEEGIDIPSPKSPMELERNERPWSITVVPESA